MVDSGQWSVDRKEESRRTRPTTDSAPVCLSLCTVHCPLSTIRAAGQGRVEDAADEPVVVPARAAAEHEQVAGFGVQPRQRVDLQKVRLAAAQAEVDAGDVAAAQDREHLQGRLLDGPQ